MTVELIKENRVVPLALLVAHHRNYRKHPETQILKIMASLQRFGQARSILVQSHADDRQYTIVAGHGVTQGAVRLRWRELRADILPADWSDKQITAYLIANNIQDDEIELAQLLQEPVDAGFDLASSGSDEETLRQMLQAQADDILREDRERTTELNEPESGEVESPYNILVECKSEIEQQRAYNLVQGEGFTCRALTL